jgi:hypothetical protein
MRRTQNQAPRFLVARFDSTCAETGKPLKKGDKVAYFPATKQAFHETSKAADQVRALEFSAAYGMADANY